MKMVQENSLNAKQIALLIIPVLLLIAFSGFIYWLLIYRKEGQFVGLQFNEISFADWGWCALGLICSMVVLFVFLKIIPMKHMYNPNVRLLADSFDIRFLALYFIPNGFYEELLFRGTLQPLLGLVPAALIFALVHISYYKKPIVLVETFIQGLVLGVLFQITGSIWVTTVAHAAFNTLQTWMIKEDVIKYRL